MSWRNAKSIEVLRKEADSLAPGRSRVSDGTIGDADHRTRSSDHNPWVPPPDGGVVTAIDITHDPVGGLDTAWLAEYLRRLGASGDRRIKYVISNRRITSAKYGWKWAPYRGSNPHTRHLHLSVSSRFYDDDNSWGLFREQHEEEDVVSRETHGGTESLEVKIWQRRLNQTNRAGDLLKIDGYFGPATEAAVKKFQGAAGLTPSGVVDLTTAIQLQAYAHNEGAHR